MHKKEIIDGFCFIEQQLCMHCGLCYDICPYDAINKNDGKFEVDEDKCDTLEHVKMPVLQMHLCLREKF